MFDVRRLTPVGYLLFEHCCRAGEAGGSGGGGGDLFLPPTPHDTKHMSIIN